MRRGSTTSRSLAGFRIAVAIAATSLLASPVVSAAVRKKRRPPAARTMDRVTYEPGKGMQVGHASWYGPGFHGRRTASGERFDRNAMTLASRHLPFGTRVRVTNLTNGKAVEGRVNDRGPFVRGRIVDLSQGMARRLGIGGVGKVRVEVIPRGGAAVAAGDPSGEGAEDQK